MKLNELRKIIREEVKAAIQEELKDILLEAVKSPKSVISTPESPQIQTGTPYIPPTGPTSNLQEHKNARIDIMNKMMSGNGNMNLTSADVNTFNPSGGNTASEGSALPGGNVGLDQIMGLMKGK
tara:strand:+ start:3779 stop:4150 length:372 start_codon:yes stop_codon:yes gene_type:complete